MSFALELAFTLVLVFAVFLYQRSRRATSKRTTASSPLNTSSSSPRSPRRTGGADAGADAGAADNAVTIVYGSQSGTAEEFAFELENEAKKYGFAPTVVDMDDYDYEEALRSERFVVMLLATFGEGEPTDSCVNFWEWITDEDERADDEADEVMDGCRHAVFALGNRQYEHFCNVGNIVHKKLVAMGSSPLLACGEGDDDGCLEDDFSAWRTAFWKLARSKILGVDVSNDDAVGTGGFVSSIKMTELNDRTGADAQAYAAYAAADTGAGSGFAPGSRHEGAAFVPVTAVRELRQDASILSTVHIEMDLAGSGVTYETADNLGVLPRNDYQMAARVAKRLGVRSDTLMRIDKLDATSSRKTGLPAVSTVMDVLLWHADIASICKKTLLTTLATYCESGDEMQTLQRLASVDGKAEYDAECYSIAEILTTFTSIKIPFHHFIELCPKMQPRFYTISSSARVSGSVVHITVAVASTSLPRGRTHAGVASTYLASLRPNKDKCAVFVRASSFRLPLPRSKPVIMIGPGTGVAPFRAFWHEMRALNSTDDNTKVTGEAELFFGCRYRERDFIYRDEMQACEKDGTLTRLHLAFSRDVDPNAAAATLHKKVYVQDLLDAHHERLWDMIDERGAVVFVCGGTAMGRSVRESMVRMAQLHGGLNAQTAGLYLKNLQDKHRYVQELWA